MALPSFLLRMPKGTTGSLFVHPETLGQQPESSVIAGHMVTALLQQTHFRRHFSPESTNSQTNQKSPPLVSSSPGGLAFLSSYISQDTLPLQEGGSRETPDLFSLLPRKHNFLLPGFPSNTAGNVSNFQ